MNFVCKKCNKKGHYTSDCYSANKKAVQTNVVESNIIEVNVLSVEYNNRISTPSKEEKPCYRFIQDDHSLNATWRKYDNFVISSFEFNNRSFCENCEMLNAGNLDRRNFYPSRCNLHNSDNKDDFSNIGIKWVDRICDEDINLPESPFLRAIEFYRDLYLAEEEGSDSYIVFHDAYTRFCVHNINWMARELRRKKLPSYIQELLKKNDKLYLEKIRRDLKELFNMDYGDLLTKSRESCGNISLDSDDEEPPEFFKWSY
jgi:hypothetical protein